MYCTMVTMYLYIYIYLRYKDIQPRQRCHQSTSQPLKHIQDSKREIRIKSENAKIDFIDLCQSGEKTCSCLLEMVLTCTTDDSNSPSTKVNLVTLLYKWLSPSTVTGISIVSLIDGFLRLLLRPHERPDVSALLHPITSWPWFESLQHRPSQNRSWIFNHFNDF